MSPSRAQRASVVVLAFGDEPLLQSCVTAILANDPGQVIVVDNGAPSAVSALQADPRITIVRPPENLGFAGGCNLGASQATGEFLVFVNSDAIIEPGAVETLLSALTDDVGLVSGEIRLASDPHLLNTAGNPVHYLGVVWAGSYGEPADAHQQRTDVAAASGAFMAITHELWAELGGFDGAYFAYHEDSELSLRVWQHGRRVCYVPTAVALHHYEFSRNPQKQYLLERNRWLTVLTVFPGPLIVAILPMLLAFELVLSLAALAQGWLPAKARGWWWLVSNARHIRTRRAQVQRASTMSTSDFARLLSARIEPAAIERPPGTAALNLVLATYWAAVRLLVVRDRRQAEDN